MTYWIGTKPAIIAAERKASDIVRGQPAYKDGRAVHNPATGWAIPFEIRADQWAIAAHPDMPVPDGCEVVEQVNRPGSKVVRTGIMDLIGERHEHRQI